MSKNSYGESVLFVLTKDAKFLCEHREWLGELMYSIPGGRVDPEDRLGDDYRQTCLKREMKEEFKIYHFEQHFIGEVWLNQEWLFYVYHIPGWMGKIPNTVLDTDRPLHWVSFDEIGECPKMPGLKALIKEKISL